MGSFIVASGEFCEAWYKGGWHKIKYLGLDIYNRYAFQVVDGWFEAEFYAFENIENFRLIDKPNFS